MRTSLLLLATAVSVQACSFDDCREGGLELYPSFRITVRHEDAVLAGVRVTVWRVGELRHRLEGDTDASGRFEVSGLLPGRYMLHAEKLNLTATLHCFRVLASPTRDAQTQREYKWPTREHLVLRAVGRLIDRGTAIAGASVRLHHPRDAVATRETVTDEEGHFHFAGVSAGTYVVELQGGTGGRPYLKTHVAIRVNGLETSAPGSLYFSPSPVFCGGRNLELVAYPAPPEQQ